MTLTVTIEPAFLALTTTPSMAPSWSEVTTPVRAVAGAVWAPADSGIAEKRMAAAATARLSLARIDFSLIGGQTPRAQASCARCDANPSTKNAGRRRHGACRWHHPLPVPPAETSARP